MSTAAHTPVPVGQMLFTIVDPRRGHEKAYNRWYERDHFYAGCMIGPGWFAGRRWAAPRRLKDLRFPRESAFAEPIDAGSYLAVYWIHEAEVDEAQTWASNQVVRLYADDRGFAERNHVHTGLYRPDSRVGRGEDGVPLELALDHGYQGLVVVVIEPSDLEDRAALIGLLDEGPAKALIDGGVADQVSTWRAHALPSDNNVPMPLGSSGGSSQRLLQLIFLSADPAERWDDIRAYAEEIERTGAGRVTFAAPFVPTVIGTDTYTDELW